MVYVADLKAMGWRLFFGFNLSHQQENKLQLKVPSLDELKRMKREQRLHFREYLGKLTQGKSQKKPKRHK